MKKKDKIKSSENHQFPDAGIKTEIEVSEFTENLINTMREHLLILDKDLRVIKAGSSFYEFFKVTESETVGKFIYELGNNQWDIPELRVLLESILPEKIKFSNYEIEHDFPSIGKRIMLLNARVMESGKGKEKIILLAIDDITERGKALKESEEKFSKAFRTSPYGITISYAESGKFIEINEAFTSITGFTREEVLADSSLGLKLWADPEDRKYIVSSLLDGREIKDKELHFRMKNGDILEGMLSAQIIYLNNKPCILSSISDITGRKIIEKKLRESEERFRSLYEDSTIGLYRTTAGGKIILANPTLVKMLGYSSFEMLALRNLEKDGFEPDYKRKLFLDRIEKEGEVKNFESAWTKTDGSIVYISESAKAIRDSGGNTLYYDGAVEDISERMRAEKALRVSENELRVILESTADGILAVDNDGKVIKANKRFAELWRIPESILEAKDENILLDFVLEQMVNPEGFLSKIRMLYKSTDEDTDLLQFKDGRVFERYSMPLFMDDSSMGRVWSFRDITKRKQAEESLLESEEKYRYLIDNMNEGIYITNNKGVILFANNALARIHGYSNPAELLNKNFLEFIEPSVREETLKNFENEMQFGNSADEIEVPIVNKDGSIAYVLIRPFAIRDGKGIVAASGIVRDITQRKRAEEEIRKSEEKYRGIFENIQDVYFETTIDGTILEVSPSIETMSKGQSRREDLIGKSMLDFYADPGEREALFSILKQKGSAADFKVTLKSTGGALIPCSIFVSVLFDEQGNPKKIVGSMRDITERKQAEEALLKLSSAIEQIVDTIVITNRNGIIEYVNPAFEKLTGYSPAEAVGKTHRIIKSGDKDRKYYEELWKTILSGGVFRAEFINKKKNGDLYYEEKTISPIYDNERNITHFVGTGVDITDRKRTELIIQQQYLELKELNASKDKFFSIIAHDLKSPFTGFLNLTEIMATESKDFTIAEFAEFSQSLNDSAVKLFKLLENLLEWASIKQGVMSFKLKTVNLFSIVSNNIITIEDRAAHKGISLVNEIDESITVSADEKMINTVLRNLLSNAVKFTKKGGTVRVSARPIEGGFIEVAVNDTGVGILSKELNKLFKIDEKVGTMGTDNELSTGLGLLLCKEFIEKHGGRIWAESIERNGSTFYFTLAGSQTEQLINPETI